MINALTEVGLAEYCLPIDFDSRARYPLLATRLAVKDNERALTSRRSESVSAYIELPV